MDLDLVAKFRRVGVEDPESWAHSEEAEDIPQLAYARLQRLMCRTVDAWPGCAETWAANLRRESERGESEADRLAKILDKAQAAGMTLTEIGWIARSVAADTAHRFAYVLGDPWDDELGDPDDMPSWQLCELSSPDEGSAHTGRTLSVLHEFMSFPTP
jgi:hypothetical protein